MGLRKKGRPPKNLWLEGGGSSQYTMMINVDRWASLDIRRLSCSTDANVLPPCEKPFCS